ncbi:ISL3 family transposase [Kibdelosporangium aridum]|uniref:ISL3 family transposase n=1 Tax=Kibdelosporangium aridum TaxID=2030 RepID=A0A428Z4Y8_KIBAR|nr:ISL3 family transposase [Kibdelosporangium aridum]RSM81906.1 ISL3 family transposase [Kibdelosporangium aridum]
MDVLLPHLSGVVVERIERAGACVRIWGRVRAGHGICPSCGGRSGRTHSRYDRRLADGSLAGQPVVLRLQVRRFFCDNGNCPVRTFAEQVDDLTVKHARRTSLCRKALEHIGLALAGRTGSRLAARLGFSTSRTALLELVHALPDPGVGPVKVLGVDDFAIRRGRKYATLLIDAVTHRRVDVLPDRRAATLAAWLREHPGVEVVCRDGSAAYAEAIRQAAPKAVQVSDRWHLWHGLAAAVEKCVVAHAACWNTTPRPAGSALAARTRERFASVHALLNQGVGLMECARRLGWALNTVKRYARAQTVQDLLRPPRYGTSLVDAHRDLVRRRLAEETPVTRILAEIREQGYTGSANLLVRYINQGRADPERIAPSPRRLVSWLMTRPTDLPEHIRRHLDELIADCPEMTTLAVRVREFAGILTQRRGQDLAGWITQTRLDALPGFDSYLNGLVKDRDATVAGLTLPYSNGPAEGVNTKVKLLKRQTYGRASFALLRKRILLVE